MKKISLFIITLLVSITSYAQYEIDPITGDVREVTKKSNASNQLSVAKIKKDAHTIQVTKPHYDNVGLVLNRVGFKFTTYNPSIKTNLLFLNCGTTTPLNPSKIRSFVQNGGVLYASDLTSELIQKAFPQYFVFAGNHGKKGMIKARVVDPQVSNVIGNYIKIHFDLGSWSILKSIKNGQVILESPQGKPLMVMVSVGKGKVFYTCFHNHRQSSEKEDILIKLLITKQVSALTNESFTSTANQMGLDLQKLRAKFRR